MRVAWLAAWLVATAGASAAPTEATAPDTLNVRADLSWLFPLNPPNPSGGDEPGVDSTPVHLPNSRLEFTDAQLHDLFFAPDWHPQMHSAMPDIVLHGRPPGTYACVYCRLPGGQGRPENAALAGLPSAYIIRQVADIKSGARRSAWHDGSYLPVNLMREVDPRGGKERLGQRVIEWAPDGDRHEKRDDEMRYIAFVPPGSLTVADMIAVAAYAAAQ